MPESPPAERLAKLRALEEWLARQLDSTRRKIRDVDQQTAVGYMVERKIHEDHPLGATARLADCTMARRETRPPDAEVARTVPTKDGQSFQACEFCSPGKTLGLEGQALRE
ncbi:DUF6233 domain-containing protein [Streptomyces sp. NPDC007971]|uniref:DUF6233 domain-containing protein n=1 Tax=Streptomyces sp. NPDC007971 TaxID=3364799 RepID=UPI0036E9A4C8